jgi:hypothetical protein
VIGVLDRNDMKGNYLVMDNTFSAFANLLKSFRRVLYDYIKSSCFTTLASGSLGCLWH